MMMMMMMMMTMMMIGKSLKSFKLVLWYLSMLFNHIPFFFSNRSRWHGFPAPPAAARRGSSGSTHLRVDPAARWGSISYSKRELYIYTCIYIDIFAYTEQMYYIYKCIYLQYIHVFTSHLNVSTPCIIFFLLWFRRSVFVDRFYGLRNSWKSWSGGGYGSKSFTPESMRGIPKITYLPEFSIDNIRSCCNFPKRIPKRFNANTTVAWRPEC